MIKNLQEQIKLELERMRGELTNIIKQLVSQENVIVSLNPDLSQIIVNILVNEKLETESKDTVYLFKQETKVKEDGTLYTNRVYGASTVNSLLENGRVVGTYTSTPLLDLNIIQIVFQTLEAFKNKEEAGKVEDAPVQ